MIYPYFTIALLIVSCGTNTPSSKPVIGSTPSEILNETNHTTTTEETQSTPILVTKTTEDARPKGMFSPNISSFVSFKKIDKKRGLTTISCTNLPDLMVSKTYGGEVSAVTVNGIANQVLVYRAIIDDVNFDKYYTYIYKNNQWLPFISPFSIHTSHRTQAIPPFDTDPNDANAIIRYYSVFDLDAESDLGYTWRLLTERTDMLNR